MPEAADGPAVFVNCGPAGGLYYSANDAGDAEELEEIAEDNREALVAMAAPGYGGTP